MKNELSRRNAYNDFDFFDEAMHGLFPPAFYGGKNHGHKYMRTGHQGDGRRVCDGSGDAGA